MQPRGEGAPALHAGGGVCVAGAHVAATTIVSSKQAKQAAAPGE